MKLYSALLFIFFSFYTLSAQSKYEYFGALKLNGDAKTVISYRVVFTENKGKITGYSVTNLGGAHETKNTIIGTYNAKSKSFTFKETDILYTKSTLGPEAFCFVNFTGNVNLQQTGSKIDGDFKGLFNNKTKCIDGTISLANLTKIKTTMAKMDKKVNKSKRIDAETKAKYNAVSIMDSLTINRLSKNQNLNMFVSSDVIDIEIWDNGMEDGDKISLFHNNVKILDEYTVSKKVKRISVKLQPKANVFRIEALNEGQREFNTSSILLVDKVNPVDLVTTLRKGETASITIIKK